MRRFTQARGRVTQLGFSPDGTILTAGFRGAMQLAMWDLPSGTFRRWHPYIDGPVSRFAYSPDGKWLAVGGEVGIVLPYDRSTNDYDWQFYPGGRVGSRVPVHALAFAPPASRSRLWLAAGSVGLTVWNFRSDEPRIPLPTTTGTEVRAVVFDPTGKFLAAVDDLGAVAVWDVARRRRLFDAVVGGADDLGFAAEGDMLAVAVGGAVWVYDWRTGRLRSRFDTHSGWGVRLAVHPNGRLLATAGQDGRVRFWDVDGRSVADFDWRLGPVAAVAFAPDGLTCAAAGRNGQVVLWDVDG